MTLGGTNRRADIDCSNSLMGSGRSPGSFNTVGLAFAEETELLLGLLDIVPGVDTGPPFGICWLDLRLCFVTESAGAPVVETRRRLVDSRSMDVDLSMPVLTTRKL